MKEGTWVSYKGGKSPVQDLTNVPGGSLVPLPYSELI